jgi:hypothetical protein
MKIQPPTQPHGEVSASGYTAGGVTLTVEKGITNNTAFISFADATISVSTAFTARGALIYKDDGSKPAICVLRLRFRQNGYNNVYSYIPHGF